jgi:serine/threonine protein kinase
LITNGINGRFVKLVDFGISLNHEFYNQSHTQSSGTHEYMAPEVLISREYDMKADGLQFWYELLLLIVFCVF